MISSWEQNLSSANLQHKIPIVNSKWTFFRFRKMNFLCAQSHKGCQSHSQNRSHLGTRLVPKAACLGIFPLLWLPFIDHHAHGWSWVLVKVKLFYLVKDPSREFERWRQRSIPLLTCSLPPHSRLLIGRRCVQYWKTVWTSLQYWEASCQAATPRRRPQWITWVCMCGWVAGNLV